MDVAALDEVLEGERCWEAVIVCPNGDGCKEGDYNLLHQKPQPFRKAKCAGKKSDLSTHSRQHTHGIRIPTKFTAVMGEWDNVKAQISGWAWKGGSILVSKHHQGIGRSVLQDKTMRCSRCEPYVTTSSGVVEVCINIFAHCCRLLVVHNSVGLGLPLSPFPPTQFDSTGVRTGICLDTLRQKHTGLRRITGRHPSTCEPDSRPFSIGPTRVVNKTRKVPGPFYKTRLFPEPQIQGNCYFSLLHV